jgi:G3E family GTPase
MLPRYIMVGGFLGAGKTTALLNAGQRLSARGLRVGLITNDQSGGLVDTVLAKSRNLPVEEISGGCFCCRFGSLMEAVQRLDTATRPDVFLAEPVGSCTDLQATVALPLRQLYGNRYAIAPLTVLVDPNRARKILSRMSSVFSAKVQYVYLKQLEEAELLAINKVDTQDPSDVRRLREMIETRFPRLQVIEVSARTGAGIDEWLAQMMGEAGDGRAVEIDYDEYAEGEARLGWLNGTAMVRGVEFDGDDLLLALASGIRRHLESPRVEIAHLKMTLASEDGRAISVVNVVQSDADPVLAFAMDTVLDAGELTVNLRAEDDPEHLATVVEDVLRKEAARRGVEFSIAHLERFRPGRPVPTHRVAALS